MRLSTSGTFYDHFVILVTLRKASRPNNVKMAKSLILEF